MRASTAKPSKPLSDKPIDKKAFDQITYAELLAHNLAWEPLHLEARVNIADGSFKGTEEDYIERFTKHDWKSLQHLVKAEKADKAKKSSKTSTSLARQGRSAAR
jgi:hypothetical protein